LLLYLLPLATSRRRLLVVVWSSVFVAVVLRVPSFGAPPTRKYCCKRNGENTLRSILRSAVHKVVPLFSLAALHNNYCTHSRFCSRQSAVFVVFVVRRPSSVNARHHHAGRQVGRQGEESVSRKEERKPHTHVSHAVSCWTFCQQRRSCYASGNT